MFHPIEAPHGAATPRPIQTQATKSLSAAQESIISRDASGAGQVEAEKATHRAGVGPARLRGEIRPAHDVIVFYGKGACPVPSDAKKTLNG